LIKNAIVAVLVIVVKGLNTIFVVEVIAGLLRNVFPELEILQVDSVIK
jgi:hypothetical protein